jgi:hypothetical protein
MTDIGVLLPVRIETRFDPGRLRVRVVPDEPWFVRHDPLYQEGELLALGRYLATVGRPADPAIDPQGAQAWSELVAHVGGPRAVFLLRTAATTDAGGRWIVRDVDPDEISHEPALPRIIGFPEELQVWLVRTSASGQPPELAARLQVDRSRLLADFPDPDRPGDHRWWEDWDEAVAAGLAVDLALADPDDIELVCVTGLGKDHPADLLAGQRDAGRLGVLAPGTVTNAVDGAPAAPLGNDPQTWWGVLAIGPTPEQRALATLLTGDPHGLGTLPGPRTPHREWGTALVNALWPALWGYAAQDIWALPEADARAASEWAARVLLPEGPFPTLRFGPHPYGVLPITATDRWVAAFGDPPVETTLVAAGLRLRALWAAGAEARGTVVGATTEGLLDLLGDVPTSPWYDHRRAWSLETWFSFLISIDEYRSWEEIEQGWHEHFGLADELGLRPARRYGGLAAPVPVEMPLVVPTDQPAGVTVGDTIRTLVDAARQSPDIFARTAVLDGEVLRFPPGSVLLRLVMRSLQVALGDVGRELAGEDPPGPEPYMRPDSVPGRMETWIRSVRAADLGRVTEATAAFHRVADALTTVASIPVDRLDGLLRATIDTANHRLDPWLTGVPLRRLDDLVAAGAATPKLGAYGWVDRPRPGAPGPDAGGLLHAPSPAQALTATVLRDRAVNDPEPARWDLDLTSKLVRTADRIAEHVRVGAHIAEALGREVERIVGRPDDVERLRRDFPVRTEHAGRRVCDGEQVLAADPSWLELTGDVLDALAELRAAVDAYGDLLVAEAVHHVTQGRAETAGAVLDAAAGLARPPQLELLRTPREGRAVATSVVLALPARPEPELPADPAAQALVAPAALADPAAAQFLTDQLGDAATWTWVVEATAGPGTATVSLADLGLDPAGALSLGRGDLERLVREAGAAKLGVPAGGVAIAAAGGSDRYERAADLVSLVGRAPAGPDAVSVQADAGPGATAAGTGAVDADLRARYGRVHQVATALVAALHGELAATTPDGGLGSSDAKTLAKLVGAARSWGIAPDPVASPGGGEPDAAERRLVAAARRARVLLGARLGAAPAPGEIAGLARADLVSACAALVSPTGQVAVTARLPRGDLAELAPAGPLDHDWLPIVAAVRAPLARVETHQLAAGTVAAAGPALVPWATKPADPWQTDAGDGRRLVVAYAAGGLDLAGLADGEPVAVAALDRWTEVIPAEEQATAAAFGFDAPAARAPQAVLLAIPPDLGVPLDDETVLAIVRDARELAHARMARPADLPGDVAGLLPTALLPANGAIAIPLT